MRGLRFSYGQLEAPPGSVHGPCCGLLLSRSSYGRVIVQPRSLQPACMIVEVPAPDTAQDLPRFQQRIFELQCSEVRRAAKSKQT